jgi:hypothetical protein
MSRKTRNIVATVALVAALAVNLLGRFERRRIIDRQTPYYMEELKKPVLVEWSYEDEEVASSFFLVRLLRACFGSDADMLISTSAGRGGTLVEATTFISPRNVRYSVRQEVRKGEQVIQDKGPFASQSAFAFAAAELAHCDAASAQRILGGISFVLFVAGLAALGLGFVPRTDGPKNHSQEQAGTGPYAPASKTTCDQCGSFFPSGLYLEKSQDGRYVCEKCRAAGLVV